MAKEARSAELAVTSLISNKREWSNCFIKFLKLRKFRKYEIRVKKARNALSEVENLIIKVTRGHSIRFVLEWHTVDN